MRKTTFFYLMLICIISSSFSQNFQYLGSYTSNGTPNYLESSGDNINVSTLELIDSALSETFQVPTYNPHYITSNYDTDIFLSSTSEVFVTFVGEGAGFRNVLGFYTYDASNPVSTAPSDEDITIIFPNTSRLGSGGGLLPGDKVSIGTFPAGTAIGWVLISNGWTGSSVGYGYWQLYSNPDFNPESDESKRHHNVLIKDDDNELIVLGFEDIQREVSWCDHDFNDALFYVTASSYTDMSTVNNINIESATNVFTSNLAGFESNGDLANAMAARSMNRLKRNDYADRKSLQPEFDRYTYRLNDLSGYFPESGMGANEVPHDATSNDAIDYANADDVFSLDYYLEEDRVSAALVTTSTNRIYDHTKSICDRLNGSILKDTRPVTLKGHEMIFAIIEKPDGNNEYAISFSVLEGEAENELLSFWNIAAYPEGDFINFQVWGKSMGQVSHIVNHIISVLEEEKTLVSTSQVERVPSVFVSSAHYRNGQLHLNIINKVGATSITMEANLKETEQLETVPFTEELELSGEYKQTLSVDVGFLFDIGLSITHDGSDIYDALYLADGPWGVDYDVQDQTVINTFDIIEQSTNLDETVYQLERSIVLEGEVYGTCNVFRNILAGDLTINPEDYTGINFNMSSTTAIEVSIVPDNIEDWDNRYIYSIPSTQGEVKNIEIPFEAFTNLEGPYLTMDNLRTIIFSVRGNYSTPLDVNLKISEVSLGYKTEEVPVVINVFNYPNPFTTETTIVLPEASSYAQLTVYDMQGRVVFNNQLTTNTDEHSITFKAGGLAKGLYLYQTVSANNKTFAGKFIIK